MIFDMPVLQNNRGECPQCLHSLKKVIVSILYLYNLIERLKNM
jgi:hypothetical protein